jgi:uncharacterized protein
MQFSGSVEIAAPRDKVWDFVSDPQQMGLCGPGVESVEKQDDDHFTAHARVGIGPIKLRFSGQAEFLERVAPERASVRGRGSAPGSAVDGTAQMTLRDGEGEGTTVMDWTADIQMSGTIASLGARLIEGTAEKLVGQTFACVKSKLEG